MNRKLVKFLSLTFLTFTLLFTGMYINVAASSNHSTSVCADDITWIYKKENGKLYRRLFNNTTRTWIGDWELVP